VGAENRATTSGQHPSPLADLNIRGPDLPNMIAG